ncbi:hypothetical protein [Pseudomonas petrae]|uniref:Uncharacterized protein n=1 Tax=Pseudomonas petrae TaxID=2912190 RepID=A0ABS9I6Q6_9PSED|nr:hypothetical protein [Pseudomonas petrae]MCF7530696.1 hypothetical protein [Pseudomonas petrae]MCF7536370.1 hypothetical protein [Pseudomonas petrae]MCF7542911.1 hypothetical protein [Pseudomonas petrae]MCF7554048.1 hypothetical protein [Pseudomonas petrae]
MEVPASNADEISIEKAMTMRASTGPGELELVVQFNDALAVVEVSRTSVSALLNLSGAKR